MSISKSESPVAAPTRTRVQRLDVARGVAVCGIAVANAVPFALPAHHQHQLAASGLGDSATELAVASVVATLVDGKFIGLFSLLFGVGLAILAERVERTGSSGFLVRRLVALFVFGLLHVVILWDGDVLASYAIVSVLAVPIIVTADRDALRPLSAIALALSVAFLATLWIDPPPVVELPVPENHAPAHLHRHEVLADTFWDPTSASVSAEIRMHRDGPFSLGVVKRFSLWAESQLPLLVVYGPRTLGLFLLGAYLWRRGLFADDGERRRRRIAFCSVAVGAACSLVAVRAGRDNYAEALLFETGVVALTLGWCFGSCVVGDTLTRWGRGFGWIPIAFARVGRMALTNYIAQSVVFTFLVESWGLARFATFDRVELLMVAGAVIVGQMIFSAVWLALFSQGPLEALWRGISYGKSRVSETQLPGTN